MYESIRKNKQKTVTIVGFFSAIIIIVFSIVGYLYFDSPLIGGVLGGLSALIYTFFSVVSASRRIMKLTKGRLITKESCQDMKETQALNIVQQMALMAHIPEPTLYVIKDDLPNAFASGLSPDKAIVAVTTGLLERLNRAEIEGVIAHEVAHIRNYDTRLKVTVFAMGTLLLILGQLIMRLSSVLTREAEEKVMAMGAFMSLVIGALVYVFGIMLSKLMELWVSRNREYLADVTAVELTRNPQALISALEKISTMEASEVAESSVSSLYFVHPFKKEGDSWFSTHPTIDNRIRKLSEL